MNFLAAALDSSKTLGPIQFGENGHVENSYSFDPDERICQYYFQLVRSKDHSQLRSILNELLRFLTWESNRDQLLTLLKIVVNTRDIVSGKGEYDLSYMQILEWYKFYPEIAFSCFKLFLDHDENPLDHQYGSWKDVKRFCQYVKENTSDGENHVLINGILAFAIRKLQMDYEHSVNDLNFQPTLIGKWLPREKSKFGWVFNKMAHMMSPQLMVTATSRDSINKARKKQKMMLKKMLVYLNKRVDTVQIKMTDPEGRWSQIDFNKVTSLTLSKNRNAILYQNKNGEVKGQNSDRLRCREKYMQHLEEAKNGDETKKIHGKRCQVGELVRDALKCHDSTKDTINMQWESNKSNNQGLIGKSIIAMCDTSGSMECDEGTPLNNAIGLSIRISELVDEDSGFKNRIMTWDARPTWIQLNDSQTFVEKARVVRHASWGMNTDFHLAIDNIIDVLVTNNIDPSVVRQLILAVFSDMQFDSQYHNGNIFETAEESIRRKFYEAGMKTTHRMPYEMPHILFWNLRKTSGFPAKSCSKNITFLSGFSSTLLNVFCTKGIEALRESTPMVMLNNVLNTDRYNIVEEFC